MTTHKEFSVHALNQGGMNKANAIADAFNKLLDELVVLCPQSRELSIARTKLEEACFFAKKAMATESENTE